VRVVPWFPPIYSDRAAGGRALAGAVAGLALLGQEADGIVCPSPLHEIAVVGQAYESFDPLEEWYVAGLLQ
jgi:hypothetical protein